MVSINNNTATNNTIIARHNVLSSSKEVALVRQAGSARPCIVAAEFVLERARPIY